MRFGFLTILGIFILTACDEPKKMNIEEVYAGDWITKFNSEISKALIANKVKGCGVFKYKESIKNKGEYVVHCSKEGSDWKSYLLWLPSQKLMGPYEPEERLN